MLKRILSLGILLLICISMSAAVFASSEAALLVDEAKLLSASESTRLVQKLEQSSDTCGAQIAVMTMSSLSGYDIDAFIEYAYDEGGYGYGSDHAGVLLLIAMDVREYRILSNGFAAFSITDYEISVISDAIVSDLSDGYYEAAFETYAEECASYLLRDVQGSVHEYVQEDPFEWKQMLLIAAGVGALVSLIVVLIMKGQLKSVRKQNHANVYVKSGSFHLTQSGDYFMYRNVRRTPKPQNNSSGGGGGFHSGGGGSRHVGGGRF